MNIFPASVEHTRNGYDQLSQVKREYGTLALAKQFPNTIEAMKRLAMYQ